MMLPDSTFFVIANISGEVYVFAFRRSQRNEVKRLIAAQLDADNARLVKSVVDQKCTG